MQAAWPQAHVGALARAWHSSHNHAGYNTFTLGLPGSNSALDAPQSPVRTVAPDAVYTGDEESRAAWG